MLRNKFSLVFFIIVFFLILLSTSVFGYTFEQNGETIIFESLCDSEHPIKEYTLFYRVDTGSTHKYVLAHSDNEFIVGACSDMPNSVVCNNRVELYELSDGSDNVFYNYSSAFGYGITFDVTLSNYYTFLGCNHDIKNTSGEVVFHRPVPTLGEVLEETNPVKTYQTMIHGMIISLMVFLVLLVGFWKAWSILSSSLRKA